MNYKFQQVLNQNHVLVMCFEVQEHSEGGGRATGEPQGCDISLEKVPSRLPSGNIIGQSTKSTQKELPYCTTALDQRKHLIRSHCKS